MTGNPYSNYFLADSSIGTRLMLGFIAPAAALQQRLPQPWRLSEIPAPYLEALNVHTQKRVAMPNVMFVFNDFLLNLDAQRRPRIDSRAHSLGLNIPAINSDTGERGMIHTRLFTDNPHGVPGHYNDALPARIRREYHVVGEEAMTTVSEHFQVDPDTGGTLDLQITYNRGMLIRVVGDYPNFPLWSAVDTRIQRVYQEESVLEVIRTDTLGINYVQSMTLQVTIPEFADLFDKSERLVTILGNPHYARKVFSPVAPAAHEL